LSTHLSFLFDTYPREVGNPFRTVVFRQKEFEQFVLMNDGKTDVFVNIYNQNKVIDKLFYDFDEPFAFEFASKFAKWLYNNNIAYVPLITPRKGYHIYVLLNPEHHNIPEIELKEKLANAQLYLIQESRCYYPVIARRYDPTPEIKEFYQERKEIDPDLFHLFTQDPIHQAKFQNGEIHAYVRIFDKNRFYGRFWYTPACDIRIIGDINRFGRVPNTKKKVNDVWSYCTYVPLDFFNMEEEEVFIMKKAPRDETRPVGTTNSLSDYTKELNVEFNNAIMLNMGDEESLTVNLPDDPLIQLVAKVINPGVVRSNLSPEPPQEARFALVTELKHHDFSENDVMDVCRAFNWNDFDEAICYTQVHQIFTKNYRKMSKRQLLSLGLATESDFKQMKSRNTFWDDEVIY